MAEDEATLSHAERVWIVSRPAASGTAYIVRPRVALLDAQPVRFDLVDLPVRSRRFPVGRTSSWNERGRWRVVARWQLLRKPAAGYHEYTVTVLTTGSPTAEGCSQPGAIIDR